MTTIQQVRTYFIETCCNAKCGITFGVETQFNEQLRRTNREFYCPNGHRQWYTEKSEAQRERERADRLSKSLEQRDRIIANKNDSLDRSRRSNAALRGVVTRTKNRVAHGQCPCCSKTYKRLADHMSKVHPNYESEPVE